MIRLHTIVFFLFLFQVLTSFSQEIKQHQWKERVLILVTKTTDNKIFKEQIAVFKKESKNFKERKLIMYNVTPKQYINDTKSTEWISNDTLYKQYKNEKSSFEIILIGLDGSIKLRQTTVVSKEDLYGLIDSMPMRRNELRDK